MKNKSLGLIETWGYVPAIEAADAGTKAAVVTLLGYEITKTALVTVKFTGDVAAVKAAVAAGTAAAKKVGKVVGVHVIPRPDPQLSMFPKDRTPPQIKKAGKSTTSESLKGGNVEDKLKTSPSIKESVQTPEEKASLIKKTKETSTPKQSVHLKKAKKAEKSAPVFKKKVGKPKKKKTT